MSAPTSPAPAASPSPAATAARATLLVIVFVLLSRVLGVVRDIVIARLFGQNTVTDVYTQAFRVPDMMYLLMAGGALSAVFVPVFTEYVGTRREEDAWRIFSVVISLVALGTAVLVLLLELAAPLLMRLIAPQVSAPVIAEIVPLTRILLPAQWCFFVGGLMMGTLQARGRFFIPALGPVLYNAFIIGGAFVFRRDETDVSALAWGALIGAFVGNFLLPLWDLRRAGMRFLPGLDLRHPGVVKVGQLLLPAMLGLSLSQIGFWMTGFFLPEGGALSALRNAYNLTQAPIGVFAQASAIVLFPTISLLAAQKDWTAFRTEISLGIRRILFLTLPTSLLMAVLAEPIIRLLYAGQKFGPSEVAAAAGALRLYSLGTFAWSAQAVLGRGFFAMQDSRTPLSITKTMIVAFAVLAYVLNASMGFGGLALAMSLVGTANMLVFLVRLGRRVGGLDVRGLARSAALIALASALSGAAAWAATAALTRLLPDTRAGAALVLLLAGGAALLVYVGACALLRLPELRGVGAMFRRSGKPKAASPA